MTTPRSPAFESADTVNRVVALLVRFPELHSVRSNPADATLTLSFAVRRKLDRAQTRAVSERVSEHVRALLDLRGEQPERVAVTCDRDAAVTFVHVTRDGHRRLAVLQFGEQDGAFGKIVCVCGDRVLLGRSL